MPIPVRSLKGYMRFLREQFYNEPSDVSWLLSTHLSKVVRVPFGSFTLFGNEDSPARIECYVSSHPNYNDQPIATYVQSDERGEYKLA